MLQAFLSVIPEAKTGKILIQRNEKTSLPKLFYTKLPRIQCNSTVVLLDPMLATGGSAILAIKEIIEKTDVSFLLTFLVSFFTYLFFHFIYFFFYFLFFALDDGHSFLL
jgi:uracil phosphoribosyltransferase